MVIQHSVTDLPKATWVAKLGGSLLEPPEFKHLGTHLQALLEDRGGSRPLLINGGGETVDLIRRWDRTFDLGEEFSHWAAVRALDLNAKILARIIPQLHFISSIEELNEAWEAECWPLLSCEFFLKEIDDHLEDPLPRKWAVTSDSIAARIASVFQACELALLKSTLPENPMTSTEASAIGFVDPYFPESSKNIQRVIAINLRDQPPYSPYFFKQ